MPRKSIPWEPPITLKRYFQPTLTDKNSKYKVRTKNHNLPILQYMYNGNDSDPLKCLITGEVGWKDIKSFINNKTIQRFNIDFNHIRQKLSNNRTTGISLDKGEYPPSHLFRSHKLDLNLFHLLEFMTIIPVCQEYHNYINQDSQYGNLTLTNYDTKCWPWFLKKETNFNQFCEKFGLSFDYIKTIDHLSNIKHSSIFSRIEKLKK